MPRGNRIRLKTPRGVLVDVARGDRAADLWIVGGRVVNVYSGEVLEANIAISGDRFAYVGPREPGAHETNILDTKGKYIVPGLIEPHSHPWVVYNPVSLTARVLPLGTTTLVHDNLFFFLRLGLDGFQRMLDDLAGLPGLHLWLARVVSQAEYREEREVFHPAALETLLDRADVVGTAEITRWPMLYDGDRWAIETLEAAHARGKVCDGHTSGASYERLNTVVAAGIGACHEAITAKEVLDRLRLGLWTVLRDSSLRPDLDEVVRAVTEHGADTRRLCMTVDGPNPTFIEERGFVDGLIRRAVSAGVPPVQAVQMATINAATYLGLDDVLGGIAPGRRADAVVVKDLRDFCADMVLSAGRVVAERGRLSVSLPKIDWKRYQSRAHFLVPESVVADPALYAFPVSSVRRNGQRATVPVIRFRSAVITERVDYDLPVRSDYVSLDDSPGLTYAALVDSDGQWITHAVVSNFVPLVDGMASTYNTTTHLLVMGRDPVSMARAAARVHAMEGGIALYQEGEERFCAALPFTGMMIMDHRFETALRVARGIAEAVREAGYPFHDILYSLLFLTCDFLPGLRITPSGVIDVKSKAVVIPATGPLVTRITREDSVSPGVGRRARSISLGKGGRE